MAGELIHPHQAVRRPAVDQGHDPPAVADHYVAWPAERSGYQDREGDLTAGLLQRCLRLARQGRCSVGARWAWPLAKLDAGELARGEPAGPAHVHAADLAVGGAAQRRALFQIAGQCFSLVTGQE